MRVGLAILTLAVYLMVIGSVVLALVRARRAAMQSYATPQEQAYWDQFRDEMDERHNEREATREAIAEAGGQPITPKPPKNRSPRPPALQLLANHFAAVLSVTLVGVTGLFAVIWGLALGAIFRPGRTVKERPE